MDWKVLAKGVPFDLFSSSSFGDVDEVINYLERGQEIEKKNSVGCTALMIACAYQKESTVVALVQSGAILTTKDAEGKTAFIHATISGSLPILAQVTTEQILNSKDNFDKNAFMYAVEDENVEIVRFLLQKGVCREDVNKGMHISIQKSNENLMRVLGNYMIDRDSYFERPKTLEDVLEILGLEKYIKNFEENDINFEKLLKMNKEDLQEIGIELLGPRKKLVQLINALKG